MKTLMNKLPPASTIVYFAIWISFTALCIVTFFVGIDARADITDHHPSALAINAERVEDGLAPRELVPMLVAYTYVLQLLTVALAVGMNVLFWRNRPKKQVLAR